MRVIFMGTPDFAVPVLDALALAGHEIVAVYSQPPRPAGRGKKDRLSPVQARAEALGLTVRTPATLKRPDEQAAFADLGAEIAVVVAYGLILPQAVLDAPVHGCINVHASLLPRWRGAAPIHRAIMAGDARTGVCIMAMEAGLDTGPVLLRDETAIGPTDTTGDLHDRLSQMGARLAVRAVAQIDRLSPVSQSAEGVTHAAKIDKAEARADLTWGAETLARHINGLSPFPGAWIERDGARIKLLRARATEGEGTPGTVLDRPGLVVAAGNGAVDLMEVQPAGKGAISGADFRNGARLAPGDPLEG
ncbi:methionyl-tRNA formyltransferase [Jannaschia rubra]|uniref:Methionyl-tRNA formyltransferase n=1 Tax=Jannaschia rubra TaxID=282197 RepID=A0A0M6XPC0_9RHOB|nr:methionyl-tRNA formyltransferase [Jannaschia rubra]CTQ31965.1 Methionyl-tRNA formyltransferase [Jannaschia rubra]SFG41022.1 methionyl-tRNA formyltransferase [Jannaschia rubra]